MAHFRIVYADDRTVEYRNVSQLTYVSVHDRKNVTVSEKIEEYPVPIGSPFWLRIPQGTVAFNSDGILRIEVTAD